MKLFGLFQNKEWNKLRGFPQAVQDDLASLLRLDSLAKSSIAQGLSTAVYEDASGDDVGRAAAALATALRQEASFAGELQLCILSTGVGKVFGAITWNLLPPERVIECLGFLAMCEFRRHDALEGEIDLKQSGFSNDPDEARTQFLVMAAGSAGVGDFRGVNQYSDEVFDTIWHQLREEMLETNAGRVGRDSSLAKSTKDLFVGLSRARQQLLLGLGESLTAKRVEKAKAEVAAKEPFDPVKNKQQHPVLYVPFPRLVAIMRDVESDIRTTFLRLEISQYDLRRLVSANVELPPATLDRLITADAKVLAYAIVVAAAGTMEEKFIGCGVWKKVTESLEKKNLREYQFMAEVQTYGMLGDVKKRPPADGRDTSLAIEQLTLVRKAPGNFLRASAPQMAESVHLLFSGTVIMRHVLNHPEFGGALAAMAIGLLEAVSPMIEELTNGELLNWNQQKDIPI